MKTCLIILTICATLFCTSNAKSQTPEKPVVPPAAIVKNMNTFFEYYNAHIWFDKDYTAKDASGHIINKGDFLQKLGTGNYLPLQMTSKSNVPVYELYKLHAGVNEDVVAMLKQTGYTYYGIYQMVGKPFPKFHYVDLNGNTYTPENTRGKIVVLKGWFISCAACVAEMPELNKLTEQYKYRKDIIFVSIATDPKPALEAFIKRKRFNYAVVPVEQSYALQTLHATGFPVHLIINKQGMVTHMSYDKESMIAALHKEAREVGDK